MRLELGTPVRCTDDTFGELADVVIDPISKRLTHLVVRPRDQEEQAARLVPVELAEGSDEGSEISLHCTVEEANRLEPVREFAYLRLGEAPVEDPDWDVGVEDVLAMPYYEADPLYMIAPGLAIFVTVLAFNLFGDGLRDALDPKLR